MRPTDLLAVWLGGTVGTAVRVAVTPPHAATAFPVATFVINVVGPVCSGCSSSGWPGDRPARADIGSACCSAPASSNLGMLLVSVAAAALGCSSGSPSSVGAMARPILLDVDTGTDDALAILYAVRHPDLNVLGISCVAGNSSVDQVVTNTLKVLDAAGAHRDLPVARGAAQPLLERARPEGAFHGDDGLGGVMLPDPAREPSHTDRGRDAPPADHRKPRARDPGWAGPADEPRPAADPAPGCPEQRGAGRVHGRLGQPRQRHRSGRVQRLAGPRGRDLRDRVTGPDRDVRTGRLHPPGRRPGHRRSVQRLG